MNTEQKLKATAYQFDAPVNALAHTHDGAAYAFGLGDGHVHIIHGDARKTVKAHNGAVPVLKPYAQDQFLSLSDDGTLKLISIDGTITDFADFKGAWTESMDVHKNGAVAVAVGNTVHLWKSQTATPRILKPHDGQVNSVCFAADGLGLVAAHRNGVTLWTWPQFEPIPLPLLWRGAHLAVTLSADKRWVVTAMQEGALHMWNLGLKRDYQMRGYWTKPTSLVWSPDKKWLATSGSDTVIIWPFDKMGPEGREPLQLGWSNGAFVTALAAHPNLNIMAAGFADGAVVMLDLEGKKAFTASGASGHGVTALAFAPDGASLIAGVANGGGVCFRL